MGLMCASISFLLVSHQTEAEFFIQRALGGHQALQGWGHPVDRCCGNLRMPLSTGDETFREYVVKVFQVDVVSISYPDCPGSRVQGPRLANDLGHLWITETFEFLGMNTHVFHSTASCKGYLVFLSRAEPGLGPSLATSSNKWHHFFLFLCLTVQS